MNRSQFLNEVAARTNAHRRDVEHVWENALAVIREMVRKGEDVSISGFGKFKQRATKARKAGTARNPFTGEMVKVAAKPASKAPRFLPAKQFKEFVGGQLKSWPASATRPMALGGGSTATGNGRAGAKKTTAKKSAGGRKTTAKKTAARKPAAKKTAKKTAKRSGGRKR